MAVMGSGVHRLVIEQIIACYQDDDRVRAVAVFGSVATGAWHELSDIDVDVVIGDDAAIQPADEAAALFGPSAAIIVTRADSADIVLDSLVEVSIRWHPLRATSPNIAASVRVVHGELSDADIAAAGAANRTPPDEQLLLNALVREAIGARKSIARGRRWEATAAVERMRRSLLALRGQRDTLQLDPADPRGCRRCRPRRDTGTLRPRAAQARVARPDRPAAGIACRFRPGLAHRCGSYADGRRGDRTAPAGPGNS